MVKIAVVISGCGFRDGVEIFETVFTLLELDKNNAEVKIYAPNKKQHYVINHLDNTQMTEERNVLIESARIARGQIQELSNLKTEDFDALILPGGFGAIANLSDIAFNNENGKVIEELQLIITKFFKSRKPIGATCISPALLAVALKDQAKVKITLGARNELVNKMGASEEECKAQDITVDQVNKIVTTPAFIQNAGLTEIHEGIRRLVIKVIEMCK